MKIFIDSSFLIAISNPKDANYQKSLDLAAKYIGSTLFFDDLVKYESVNILLRKSTIAHARNLEKAISLDTYQKIFITDTTWKIAFSKVVAKYTKSGPNVFDFIHFACMQEYGLKDVLTFDHHFASAGFNVLK